MDMTTSTLSLFPLRRCLEEFRKLNPDIKVSAAMAFLMVCTDDGTTVSGIAQALGIPLATASRYVSELGRTNRYKTPGYGLVEMREVITDRRNKEVRLTAKGRAVRDSLMSCMGG
jgi:DNA-binding MarR family transcriptional regulator